MTRRSPHTPGLLATCFAIACLALGCGSSNTTDAGTDIATTDRPPSDDRASDSATPDGGSIFLLTVQGPLRAAPPGDGGAIDAGPGDASADAGDAAPPFPTEYARMVHNDVVARSMAAVMAAGDVTHHVGLGLSDASQFLAVDTWNNLTGLTTTISNPTFQAAFGALFAGMPRIGVWAPAAGYTTYNMPPPAGAPRIILVIQGTLRSPGDSARMTHNNVVMGAMSTAVMNGDISHTVYLGVMDPSRFLAFDVWTNPTGLMNFLRDPALMSAFGMLFSGIPTVELYTAPMGWTVYGMPAWGTP